MYHISRHYNMVIRQMALAHTNQPLHYATSDPNPVDPTTDCRLSQLLLQRCAIILRQVGSPPSLHSSPDYTPTHTTDTQLTQRQSKHSPVDRDHCDIRKASRDSTGGSAAVPGWPKGWGKRRRRGDYFGASTARDFRFSLGWEVERRTSIRLR